jgi:hypothetical protein
VSEQRLSLESEGKEASLRLNESLKSCQSLMSNYREMIGRVVGESVAHEAVGDAPIAGERL